MRPIWCWYLFLHVHLCACFPALQVPACLRVCHSANLLSGACTHPSVLACVRAIQKLAGTHASTGLQVKSAEQGTLNCQLYVDSASFCMRKNVHKNQNAKYSSAPAGKLCLQILSCSLPQSLPANFVMQRFACKTHKVCLQCYNLCHAEVVQRLHWGCAGAVQRLSCVGSTTPLN